MKTTLSMENNWLMHHVQGHRFNLKFKCSNCLVKLFAYPSTENNIIQSDLLVGYK